MEAKAYGIPNRSKGPRPKGMAKVGIGGQAQRNRAIEVYLTGEPRCAYVCDLCVIKTPFDPKRINKDRVCLCPACHKHMTAMPEGIIKDTVTKFLMGNVI